MLGNKKNRVLKILELLQKNETMTVKSLAETFGVSEMTIRRDLEELKKTNVLERSYGRATIQNSKQVFIDGDEYYDITVAQLQRSSEKDAIARYAASLIEPGDFVIIDSGTTTHRIAKHMQNIHDITVLCYNYNILSNLQRNMDINIIFGGGYYHPEDKMFTSRENVEFIRSLRANKAFISASGFHSNLGITCIHSHEVDNKQAAIASSAERILVMDSSKFGLVRPAFFASLSDINILITDNGISQEWRNIVLDANIDLRIVSVE